MSGDKDIARFKKDAKSFGISAAGHLPGVGRALGIHDTYQKGRKLTKSTPRALNVVKRKVKTTVGQRIRRITRSRK